MLPGYGGEDGSTWALRQALSRANYRSLGFSAHVIELMLRSVAENVELRD